MLASGARRLLALRAFNQLPAVVMLRVAEYFVGLAIIQRFALM